MSAENIYLRALEEIRRKVHAHNRGGDLSPALREEVRNICDAAFAAARAAS